MARKSDSGFLDNIFDNNVVVFAARLVLFSGALVLAFAAAYTTWSIVSWMKLRQWLKRAGPFEVSQEAITDLKEEVDFWRDSAVDANAENQALSQRVDESNDLIERMSQHIREQEMELERSRESEI